MKTDKKGCVKYKKKCAFSGDILCVALSEKGRVRKPNEQSLPRAGGIRDRLKATV